MREEYLEKVIKKSPLFMLENASIASGYNFDIDDDMYYNTVRLRHLLTPKVLKQSSEIIEHVFSDKMPHKFVHILFQLELLEIIFPGIYALIRVDGGHYHNETVYTHVTGALRALSKVDVPWYVKLAALYHDVGKCKWELSAEGKRRFKNHAQNGVSIVEKDLTRLGIDKDIIEIVKTLVGLHMSQIDGPHSIRKLARALDDKKIPHKYFFWVRYADNKGSAVHRTNFMYYWGLYRKFKTTLHVKKEPSVTDLCINGHTLMREFGLPPGKWIGQTLNYLFVGVQQRGYVNEPEFLLEQAKTFVKWYDNNV